MSVQSDVVPVLTREEPPEKPIAQMSETQGGQPITSLPSVVAAEPPPPQPPKLSRRASLFSGSRPKSNSTDTVSLLSTMSSASVMIRKLGNIGSKLPSFRSQESFSGITSIFRKPKKVQSLVLQCLRSYQSSFKKSSKAEPIGPSVSYTTAQPDRVSDTTFEEEDGLTPAARLAREHVIKNQAVEKKADAAIPFDIVVEQPSPTGIPSSQPDDSILDQQELTSYLKPAPKTPSKGILKRM